MKRFRMLDWLIISLILLALVAVTSPKLIPVLLLKATQVTLYGWIGYWFDRGIAPNQRPDDLSLEVSERSAAGHRRAIIIGAAMIAGALGA